MADEPQAVPASEEEEGAPEDEAVEEEVVAPEPKPGQKKPRAPKPRFGQVLNVGGQFWTVQASEGNRVRVARRIGNAVVEGPSLSLDEFAIASKQPLPKDIGAKGSAFASRGLSLNRDVSIPDALGGSARVLAYDAVSGDVQLDVAGRGPVWTSKNTIQNLVLPEGDQAVAVAALADVVAGRPPAQEPKPVPKRALKTKEPVVPEEPSETIPPAARVPAPAAPEETVLSKEIPSAPQESEMELPEPELSAIPPAPSVRVTRAAPVGQAPAVPSVRVTRTVRVGEATPSVAVPTIRQTRAQLKADIEQAKTAAPGAVGIRAGVGAAPAPATPVAAALGVASAALGAITAGTARASAAAAAEQQALYAHAAHALEVVQSRAAEKRRSVQDLQTQADALRQEIAGLNAQAAAPTAGAYRAPADVAPRIQAASQELGGVQSKLAMARYGLQTDEAQAQQLRISTNMMKNLAPEVQRGQVPQSVVGLVAQSIPPDVTPPQPARAAVLIATLQPGVAAPAAPETIPAAPEVAIPRSFAAAPPPTLERPAVSRAPEASTAVPEQVRARLSRGGLALPQATAVALSAGQQADRATALGYQESLGSPDARMAAFAQEGAGAQPVIRTIPKSYTEAERAEEAEDLFQPGGGAESAEFAEEQRRLFEAQEQFLPGTTGGPQPTEFVPETTRAQRVRPEPEGPDEEALRAAALQAQIAQTRAAALQAFDVEREEEEATGLKRVEKLRAQAESARRNVSRLIDLFNSAVGAATVETVIGALLEIGALLLNMNGRLFVALITYRNKKAVIRKIFPPAQVPIEAAFIVATDILVASVVFVSVCMMLAPFIILYVLAIAGVGGIIFGIVSATGS